METLDKKLVKKYKELRRKFPGEEYAYLFTYLPGLADIDVQIKQDDERARERKIKEYQDDYWNLTSFVFHKIKDSGLCRKWSKEQFDCQFGVCAICNKPISNLHNSRVEHVISPRKFGSNYSSNLVLVHKNCKRRGTENLSVNLKNYRKNRFAERLDERVLELTADTRKDYPVEFPDKLFKAPE